MKILLIDAYDSFVQIVKNYLNNLGHDVDLVKCDKIACYNFNNYDVIFLGPGPGHPKECGYIEVIKHSEGKLPIFGICLGMQAIAEYYGIDVIKSESRQHGKVSRIRNTGKGCFNKLPLEFNVTRYHSLVADKNSFTSTKKLDITATSLLDNHVMGVRHNNLIIEGVQFHPESITTEYGMQILDNFLKNIKK